MADDPRYVQQTTTETTDNADRLRNEEPVSRRDNYAMNVAARFVSMVGGIIMGLLALRFVLRLLGANPSNAFADFIYSVSHPFAAPFFGLFNYDTTVELRRFEFETLVAIAVYALITWLIIRLVTLGKP